MTNGSKKVSPRPSNSPFYEESFHINRLLTPAAYSPPGQGKEQQAGEAAHCSAPHPHTGTTLERDL